MAPISNKTIYCSAAFAVPNLFLYLVALAGWHLMPNGIWGLYSLSDGAWSAWQATSIFTWSEPFDLSPYSFLQGLGSLYPPNTPWLNPGALALTLPADLPLRYYLSYSIYFFELLISTLVFCRSVGMSILRSTIVAQLLCLIVFPPFTAYLQTLPYLSLGPFYAHLISMFLLALVLFHALGRAETRGNILIMLGMLFALASAIYSAAVTFTTLVPVYGLFGIAILTYMPDKKSITWKVGTVVGLLLLSVTLGFPDYYLGTARVSSSDLLTADFPEKIGVSTALIFVKFWKAFNWCAYPQTYLCSDYPIFYLHAGAFAGVATGIIFAQGLERRLAFGMAAFIVVLHAWPVLAQIGVLGKLARISPLYFQFAAYPFYAYFAVCLVIHLTRALRIAYEQFWLSFVESVFRRMTQFSARIEHLRWLKLSRIKSVALPFNNREKASFGCSILSFMLLLAVPAASVAIMREVEDPQISALRNSWFQTIENLYSHNNNSDLIEENGELVLRVNGKLFPVRSRDAGFIEHVNKSHRFTTFRGWAIDRTAGIPAKQVMIYIGGKHWGNAAPDESRPDVAAMKPTYLHSGFNITTYMNPALPWSNLTVRAFALMADGSAKELEYSEGYPFCTSTCRDDSLVKQATIARPLLYVPPASIQRSTANAITDSLEKEIGLKPGATFNGFVTTYFGGIEGPLRAKLGFLSDDPPWAQIYFDSRFYMKAVYDNSFMTTDLWERNIPSLNEYGQWITKPLYAFTKEIFATPKVQLALHEINLYRMNLKLLRALGVRFIVTDAELDDPQLRLHTTLSPGVSSSPLRPEIAGFTTLGVQVLDPPLIRVFLYEVRKSNLASFSPKRVFYRSSAVETIQALEREDFDPVAEVIVNERLAESKYESATDAKLTVSRGHLNVKARSSGKSILLLPIQFSHCLKVKSFRDDKASLRLVRANLVQSGLVFENELDAEISFVFGPGRDVSCRKADVEDFQRLDFSKWVYNFLTNNR